MQGRVGWGSNVHLDIYSHDAVTSQDLLPQVHTCGSVIHVGWGGSNVHVHAHNNNIVLSRLAEQTHWNVLQ